MDPKKLLNRTNSVIGQIKWWPSSINSSNSITTNENNNSNNNNHSGSPINKIHFGSSIAVQKLRESKWFIEPESRIFCAVIECGFIVEIKEGQENDPWFGIVTCKTTKDKKPIPENVNIFTIRIKEHRVKCSKITLVDVWNQGCCIRINNFGDKEKQPHSEKDIKNQLSFAQKTKTLLWHNSQHFAHWCRYGDRQQDIRRRQMSETMQWGSIGMNAGIILMNRQKSDSTSK